MLIKLVLFGISTGLTIAASGKVRHPRTKALFSMIFGCLFASLAFFDVRLIVLPLLFAFFYMAIHKSYIALVPLVPCVALFFLILSTPHADEQLYLDARYTDNFIYIDDGLWYSESLDTNIVVHKRYGDTYQSELYDDLIASYTIAPLHHEIKVWLVRVEKVQTNRLFPTFTSFCEHTKPVVHLVVSGEKAKEIDYERFPYKTYVEVILP